MRDLVERAQRGDRDAFAAQVGLTSDRMYALASRILRDGVLAEDALQSALIIVWRQLPNLRDPDRFEAWARRLLVHACYAEARRRRTWAANVRILPIEGPAGPDGLLPIDLRDALDRAFRRLTVEQRAVFVLHHHVGLQLTEVAETSMADRTAMSAMASSRSNATSSCNAFQPTTRYIAPLSTCR